MARTKRRQHREGEGERIYRAVGYARLSVEDSGRPGADTIEVQRRLIADYIAGQRDMRFCGLFSDNGRTGTNFDRPAFEHMMEEIRAGRADCVVVKDLSRFGRNYLETGEYLQRIFPCLGVRFVAIHDHFDTLTAEWGSEGYIVPLKNIINEAYSRDISRKVLPALAARQRRGEFIGSWAAYGYRRSAEDPHRLEPDREAGPVVRKIFAWRSRGMSCRKIARTLNELLIPSPSRYLYLTGLAVTERFAATLWTAASVRQLLGRGVYLGNLEQGQRRSAPGLKKSRALPREQWIVVTGTHQPLVDGKTFAVVQDLARRQKAAYGERVCPTHRADPSACPGKSRRDPRRPPEEEA